MNRVEGDLQIHLTIEDHLVTDARCMGTMFRGIENVMIGRGPLDGLVITPRICGICTTAHLNSAARALDMAYHAHVPDNGKRVRNITLMVEQVQNDMRHSFLLFMPDAANPAYKDQKHYEAAKKRYEPLKGSTTVQVVREVKKILEVIAIMGGQWPHSSFMVPGGVVCIPSSGDIAICRHLLKNFRSWYENAVLGCTIDRIMEIQSQGDLYAWLDEKKAHSDSELGFFIRFCRSMGLDRIGMGNGNFICFGALEMPDDTRVSSQEKSRLMTTSGFVTDSRVMAFSPDRITEDITSSWLTGGQIPRHPFEGKTISGEKKQHQKKYTWAKAPRYDQLPAETGPLAEMLVNQEPLFSDIIKQKGASVFSRQLARILRPARLLPVLDQWLNEMLTVKSDYFETYDMAESCRGFGLVQAPRGALGHWVAIEDNKIKNYQVITPTAWNASPRDINDQKGPMEEAICGVTIKDRNNPVEVEHIIRSFDPCMVCTVH